MQIVWFYFYKILKNNIIMFPLATIHYQGKQQSVYFVYIAKTIAQHPKFLLEVANCVASLNYTMATK